MAELREVTDGLRFPEGPVWMPDGSLIVVEAGRGTLTRIDVETGAKEIVAEPGGAPNGAAIGPDGALYVCNNGGMAFIEHDGELHPAGVPPEYRGGWVERVDPTTGEVTVLYRECDGIPLVGPNDIVFDETGNFWFTDHPKKRARDRDWGALYYAAPDGSMIREVRSRLDDPNGVGLSPDLRHLYVADTRSGRLWMWELEEPGVIRPREGGFMVQRSQGATCLATMPGVQFFDSLAVEASGRVVVATIADPPAFTTIDPADGSFTQVLVDDPIPTNLCFGGPDLRTAYLTVSARGRVLAMDWPSPGLRLEFADRTPGGGARA